jgi:hypothetical protein
MAGQFVPGHLSFLEPPELVGTSRHEFPLSVGAHRQSNDLPRRSTIMIRQLFESSAKLL